ncbi:RidA family protein [Leisingera sp. ANG-DT]|uniref:RidA family protein n=1 Tax=Leisingera sp. ANG-DT TaxID=1577897 RepID=UPI00057F9614|nr:RidA family protein [Leisingera sp. ANG-DT]KIC15698.1 endoribonuclease [Leisingera sp. ANG-DT]
MTISAETRIANLGLVLPEPPKSVANYVATKVSGNLLFISGQLCLDPAGKLISTGAVTAGATVEDAVAASRACAVNILAQARAALGSLDCVSGVSQLRGYIAAPADFSDHAPIMNGASDLMVEVFGDAGRHTRATVGVSSLPLQATVEVEAIFEVHP